MKTLLSLIAVVFSVKLLWKLIKYTLEIVLTAGILFIAIAYGNTDTRTPEDIEIENSIRESVNEFLYECSLDSIK